MRGQPLGINEPAVIPQEGHEADAHLLPGKRRQCGEQEPGRDGTRRRGWVAAEHDRGCEYMQAQNAPPT